MRRSKQTSIGALTCGLVLAAGAVVGVTPASAASSPTDLQTTMQAVQNAAEAAAQATGTALPTAPAAPISVLSNELGNTSLPSQGSTTPSFAVSKKNSGS